MLPELAGPPRWRQPFEPDNLHEVVPPAGRVGGESEILIISAEQLAELQFLTCLTKHNTLDARGDAGPVGAWTLLAPRVFYSALLGLGVYFSMRRQQAKRGTPPPPAEEAGQVLGRVRRIAGVWLFFALIHIWNITPARLDFGQRTSFFLSLFGFG